MSESHPDSHPVVRAFLQGGGKPHAMTEPLAALMKGEILRIDAAEGVAELAFSPDERFVQGAGVLQGGIVTSMLDFSMALAAFSRLEPHRSLGTVSLSVHFLKAALPGRHTVRARLDRMGGSMAFASAELFRDGAEGPIGTGTAVMALTRK